MKTALKRPHRVAFRRKWWQLLILVLAFSSAAAQENRYAPINGHGFKYKRVAFDSVLMIPLYESTHLPYRSGAIKYRASDSSVYVYTGTQWIRIIGGGDEEDTFWELDGSNNLVNKTFPGSKIEINKRLSILDSGYVATSNLTGSNPGEGTGYKSFWHPGKAALRSGYSSFNAFDDAQIGLYSFATGYDSRAAGLASVAMGIGVYVSSQGGIGFGGSGVTVSGANALGGGLGSVAGGAQSVALGNSANSPGVNSVAIGFNPESGGANSAAFNAATRANGVNSFATGEGSDANAVASFVGGQFNRTNYSWVIPQFIIGRFSDTTISSELFRIGWGSHVGGPKDNLFSVDTFGHIKAKAPADATTGYSVVVWDPADEEFKKVDAGDITGAAATRTEVRIGIGVDTTSIPGNQDTVHLEENRLIGTIDQKIAVVDTYVANDGDDADDGETEATAKETLTAATDSLVSKSFAKGYSTGLLRANSIFREQYTPTNNGIRLGAYGMFDGRTQKLPMISASIPLTGGADTASMYKITKTHSLGAGNPGYDYFTIVEIDTALEKYYPVLARRYLRVATSIANADATPGSFYQPNMVSPTPVYVNPTEGNIGSNKYRYEIGDKLSAIYSLGYTGNYTNLWLENGVSGYGTVGGTSGGVSDIYLSRSVLQGGATHTSVIKSGMVENCVYITGSLGGTNGNTGHVFYEGNGLGNYGVFRRSIMFDYESFLLAHQGEGVNDPIEYVAYQDNYLFGDPDNRGGAMGTGVVKKVEVSGNYLEYSNSFYRGGATEQFIFNNVFRDIQNESGVEVPSALPRASHLVDNLIEFFTVNTTSTIFMWSTNQNGHNTNFNHNTVYAKAVAGSSEPLQLFARNTTFGSNTPYDVHYNIFISNTPSGTRTRVATVDQNSSAGVSDGYVADYNIYIILSGDGYRWVVLNPSSGGPNKDGLSVWQAATNQDDNSIEIDLTANPNGLQDIFIDPTNGNWALTNSANANLIRAMGAGKRNPPTFYPKKPLFDEAVATMQNGAFKTPSEQWQYPNYATALSGSGTNNANTGAFYRWLKPGTQEIKTVAASNTILWDSASNTNALTANVDTSVIATQYDLTQVSGGGSTDTTRFWHLNLNHLGSPGKLGSSNISTVGFWNSSLAGILRWDKSWIIGDDSVGINVGNRFTIKSTTGLGGFSNVGTILGATPPISIFNTIEASANSQRQIGLTIQPTLTNPGAFTSLTYYPVRSVINVANVNWALEIGNTNATGGASQYTASDALGSHQFTSTGIVQNTTGGTWRTTSTSSLMLIQVGTGNNKVEVDSTGVAIGGFVRATQKLRVLGNTYAATQGTAGAQAAFVAGVYQNTSTAAAGTVTHASVIGIAQSTLASTNTITTTNASSVYIENAPLGSSTNTITNPYALYVAAGKSFFGDDINIVDAAAAQLRLTHTAGTQYGEVQVNGSGNWFLTGSNTSPRIGFGGTTSGFPGLTRDGASLQVTLADGSANANLKVLDQAYDATTWNGNDEVPTKNAIRDKVEALNIINSTYTPTFTNGTNVDGVTAPGTTLYYERKGNQVTVWGNISVDATAASVATNFAIDLPVASAMTGLYQLSGQMNSWSVGGGQGGAEADVTNDRANFSFQNGTATGAVTYTIRFSYEVL